MPLTGDPFERIKKRKRDIEVYDFEKRGRKEKSDELMLFGLAECKCSTYFGNSQL